jgi:hypothetical protein
MISFLYRLSRPVSTVGWNVRLRTCLNRIKTLLGLVLILDLTSSTIGNPRSLVVADCWWCPIKTKKWTNQHFGPIQTRHKWRYRRDEMCRYAMCFNNNKKKKKKKKINNNNTVTLNNERSLTQLTENIHDQPKHSRYHLASRSFPATTRIHAHKHPKITHNELIKHFNCLW